jgi:uncharacterized protein YndB with AHSA1/START domain
MKVVKGLGMALLTICVVLFFIALFAPKDFSMKRSMVFEATPEQIYPLISDFQQFQNWSPWKEKDPNAINTFTGTPGQAGHAFSWKGNHEVGTGTMRFDSVFANRKTVYALDFMEPFESHATGEFILEPADKGTRVTWSFNTHFGFVESAFMVFMSMEKMLGGDFEKGLSNMKTYLKEHTAAKPVYVIKEVNLPTTTYLVMRKTMPFADVAPSYYEAAFKATDAALKKAGGSVAGAPVCLVFKWDMSTQQADLGAGFPCQVSGNEFAGLQRVDMPAGKSYQIDYYGNYDGTGAAHSAMEQYLQSKGLTPNYPCFEQFMTDPGQEPDTAKWLTRVVYFAK